MKNKSALCPQYETFSLDNKVVEDELNILRKTISFLEEQIVSNKNSMRKLVRQLSQKDIKYTYSNTGELIIDSIENDQKAASEKSLNIQQSYNTFYRRNIEINTNIEDLKKYFIRQLMDSSLREIYNEVEEKGISILKAQEMERSRIACDLHDSVVQNLTSLVHKTELCIKMVDRDIIGVKLDLQLVMQEIKSVINDIRGIIYNLKPMALEDLGLEVAVKRYLEQFEENQRIRVNFNCECKGIDLETSVISITLFRIIQEACSNAVKHGSATIIDVSLSNDDKSIMLSIKDNGIGFDLESVNLEAKKDNSGYGLSIMKERICLLSGSIHIDSKRYKGTVINVIVPIQC